MGTQSARARIPEVATADAIDDIVEFHSVRELMLPLCLPALLTWCARSMIIIVLPIHVLQLGYSYDDVGYMIALLGFGSVISNVPTGALIEWYGPKALILLSSFLMCFGAICAMLTNSFHMMGFACFVFGLAESSGILARATILSACIRSNLRGQSSSMVSAIPRIAYTFAPLIAGAVAQYQGPKAVYLIQAVLSAFSGLMAQRLMPYVRSDQDLQGLLTTRPSAAMSQLQVAKAFWRPLSTVTLFVVCLSILRKSREILFPLVGHDAQLAQHHMGIAVSMSYALDALMFPIAGKLLDTIGRSRTGAVASVIFVFGILVLLDERLWSYIAFSAVSGIANGLSAGLVTAMGIDLAPATCRSQFLAVYRTLGRMADLIAPLLVGEVAELASLQMAELVIGFVGLIGAAWILRCAPESLQSPTQMIDDATQVCGGADIFSESIWVDTRSKLIDNEAGSYSTRLVETVELVGHGLG